MYFYFVGYFIFQLIFLVVSTTSYNIDRWTDAGFINVKNRELYSVNPGSSLIVGFGVS
jgi:hypothetical protein